MDRVSTRTDLARRLELSQVEEVGDLVSGRVKGLVVTLEGEPPFTACGVDLGAAIPIARLVMRPDDLNHPDSVETGEADFDEPMQVTALASYAPTLQRMLSEAGVRSALLQFFKRHPDASFTGSKLRVPSAGGVTKPLIAEALAIAQVVAERFAAVGFLESEEAAKLPRGSLTLPTVPRLTRRVALGVGLCGVAYVGFAWLFRFQPDANGLWCGLSFVFIGVMGGVLVDYLEGP